MVNDQLHITLEGSGIGESSVPVGEFAAVLAGVQDAMRLMVVHLGGRRPGPGRPSRQAQEQSRLLLTGMHPGSVVATMVLAPPQGAQLPMENVGQEALEAFQNWDGGEGSTLPDTVTSRLYRVHVELPGDRRLWFGNAEQPRRVEVRRTSNQAVITLETEPTLLHGWLKEINWASGTAQLHDYSGGYVRLQFEPSFNDEMLRLATQYVEVNGKGKPNKDDDWTSVYVERISETRSWREPFDLEAFRNNPSPKTFDPEKVITASEPFDVDHFIRTIHEGRDVRREDSAEW